MRGRVEAKATIPAGGAEFTMSITGLVGTSVRTIAAGAYWPDELWAAFEAQLEAGEIALGGAAGFTISTRWGESSAQDGTVLVEYDDSGVNFAISAWGSTLLRDYLGFTATLSGADSYAASRVTQGIWRADVDYDAKRGTAAGALELDRSVNVGPTGVVTALGYGYPSRQKLGRVTWPMVGRARALEQYESVVGESFEAWFANTHGGRLSWFGSGPLVRFYWDADDTDYEELRLTEPMRRFDPDRVDPQWTGLWPVAIDGYLVP